MSAPAVRHPDGSLRGSFDGMVAWFDGLERDSRRAFNTNLVLAVESGQIADLEQADALLAGFEQRFADFRRQFLAELPSCWVPEARR